MGWRIEFEGEVYREGDLTLGQCEKIEEATGQSWLVINPLRSAKQARLILQLLAAERTGEPLEEVEKRVAALSADEYLNVMHSDVTEDDRPTEYVDGNPPVADEPSTPG